MSQQHSRVGFVTCVQLGLSCIEEILAADGRLDFVVTLEDSIAPRKSGRVFLDDLCTRHGIDLFKVRNINDGKSTEFLRARRPDWLFIIGWSQIARPEVLDIPSRGVLGMHPTLLPVGRGRAAIPWAILKGLSQTGVTLFQLDEGVDSGPIMLQQPVPVEPRETATSLYEKIGRAHRDVMRRAWSQLLADQLVARPQDESAATYWPGRKPLEGQLYSRMETEEMDRLVRAATRPYPGAFWVEPDRVVRVWAGEAARGTAPAPNVVRLPSRDGAFDAIEFDFEPSVPFASRSLDHPQTTAS